MTNGPVVVAPVNKLPGVLGIFAARDKGHSHAYGVDYFVAVALAALRPNARFIRGVLVALVGAGSLFCSLPEQLEVKAGLGVVVVPSDFGGHRSCAVGHVQHA